MNQAVQRYYVADCVLTGVRLSLRHHTAGAFAATAFVELSCGARPETDSSHCHHRLVRLPDTSALVRGSACAQVLAHAVRAAHGKPMRQWKQSVTRSRACHVHGRVWHMRTTRARVSWPRAKGIKSRGLDEEDAVAEASQVEEGPVEP